MNRYLRAVSANMLLFGLSTLFFLVITPVAIRLMGDEFYGAWAILNALMLLSNVGTLGMASIVSKYAR